ncbi:MAG: polysaccharide deacetylase family protein [Magnetococcales bacterium]|nr:polysaccharide deacetylase family protein [Magnetococcales bacterium]MBF0148621.1 polysaccharide deacetylase family protein [Magnetococcales bacterium]MBF0172739.1 polysaccharide deacetylase family protein [Magnetococcales bacterium]MBF0630862.1 polysaccharide deacetylase family protein [Magnetococcales bacterium]
MLWFFLILLPEQGSSSNEHVRIAKHTQGVSRSSYLSPGGEFHISWSWLSLPEDRIMALTFDDGPVERDLEISALLQHNDIEATFFFIGQKVEQSPGIVKKVSAAHHEIGYHSYRHQKLSWIPAVDLKEDFRLGKSALAELGIVPNWFRPPYGLFNAKVIKTARSEGLETILWTIDPKDWTGVSPRTITKRVVAMFHPGAVLLFHSNHSATLQALPQIIEAARAGNYRLVSLSEWHRTIQAAHCRHDKSYCSPTVTAKNVQTTIDTVQKMDVTPMVSSLEIAMVTQPTVIKRHSHPLNRKRGRHKTAIPMRAPAAVSQENHVRPLPFL